MTTLTIKELEELNKQATLEPWKSDGDMGWIVGPTTTVLSASHDNNYASEVSCAEGNIKLIFDLRNNLPTLINQLKLAKEMAKFYEGSANQPNLAEDYLKKYGGT